jgi:hypothetical protein
MFSNWGAGVHPCPCQRKSEIFSDEGAADKEIGQKWSTKHTQQSTADVMTFGGKKAESGITH